MIEQLKKIAQQTGNAQVPTRFLYGLVTKTAPLTVLVDGRFQLSGDDLVQLADHRHPVLDRQTEQAQNHSHHIEVCETEPEGRLLVGDKVVLLRNLGGQEYLLLGRVAP